MKARWPLLGGGVLLAGTLAIALWLQCAPVEPLPPSLEPEIAALPQAPPRAAPPPSRVRAAPAQGPAGATAAGLPPQPDLPPSPPDVPPAVVEGPSGIGLFPPPGTKPIKRGIIVPEGFELPVGYVRHYQTTDDGQRQPAILMYHPDDPPLDEAGRPIDITPDRIVPPERAPKGMPIQYLDPPRAEGEGG